MPSLKLHIKTALIASAVALVLLVVSFLIVSANIASQIRQEQRTLAQLQAENLADAISNAPAQLDEGDLRQLVELVSGSRPNLVTVRVWKVVGGDFVEQSASDESPETGGIPPSVREALITNSRTRQTEQQPEATNESIFRIYVPVAVRGQVTGAVEVVERLDTVSSIALRYLPSFAGIAAATIVLMTAAFYLVFQNLVYQPLELLLDAMDRARAGDLAAEVKATGDDEFGRVSSNFNAMMSQIREMTGERERRNEELSERIAAATLELTQKNEQLGTANRDLFDSTRRIAEMERLAAAGQTAAQFAHEVGTPLNLISGHVQLLSADLPPDSKEGGRLATISRQIERIELIVREMLDRTRFGATEHLPMNLNELLRRLFDAIEPALDRRSVTLDARLEPGLPSIAGDANRLQQVFLNLFNNALDAMPDGGTLTVRTLAAEDGRVVVEFADDGTGMDEETRAKIFQPLFTTKERGRGTGLGLVVVRQILNEHEAEISVESAPGEGARFILSFPAA